MVFWVSTVKWPQWSQIIASAEALRREIISVREIINEFFSKALLQLIWQQRLFDILFLLLKNSFVSVISSLYLFPGRRVLVNVKQQQHLSGLVCVSVDLIVFVVCAEAPVLCFLHLCSRIVLRETVCLFFFEQNELNRTEQNCPLRCLLYPRTFTSD